MEELVQEAKRIFPNVPSHLLERIASPTTWNGDELPFNRRRRRQIAQAKTVVLHLFSGVEDPNWKRQEQGGVVVVTLDVLHGSDLLHNDSLVGWIQEMAMSGRVDLWLAGPPCRSVSALRCKADGGPVHKADLDSQDCHQELNKWSMATRCCGFGCCSGCISVRRVVPSLSTW